MRTFYAPARMPGLLTHTFVPRTFLREIDMAERIITGFHAIEEKILQAAAEKAAGGMTVLYGKTGPRVKKILLLAKESGVPAHSVSAEELDTLVKNLSPALRDHRGIVLSVTGAESKKTSSVDFDAWLLQSAAKPEQERQTVIILDSVTDPHNIGAIIRSCDQFGASLVILPEHRSTHTISENETVARSSAGSSVWVPFSVVTNLVRAVQRLKENGFWIYGADAGGSSVNELSFPPKSVIVMGSEGAGIAKLLEKQCDSIISIPTCGKIDSLNVSVAAGVLLYEVYRQSLQHR